MLNEKILQHRYFGRKRLWDNKLLRNKSERLIISTKEFNKKADALFEPLLTGTQHINLKMTFTNNQIFRL